MLVSLNGKSVCPSCPQTPSSHIYISMPFCAIYFSFFKDDIRVPMVKTLVRKKRMEN